MLLDKSLARISEHMSKLRSLSINHCSGLTESGISLLSKLTALQHLDLTKVGGVNVTSSRTLSHHLLQMKSLTLYGCGETDVDSLCSMAALRTLDIRFIVISSEHVRALTKLQHLEVLCMD